MSELVSVCIPVYNGEDFIERTIDSVLRQTYSDIEILVVDNCSEDQTCKIVSEINDERIRLVKNEKNLGMAGNWNRCLEISNGKYILLLCADDTIKPECIAKKVQAIKDNDAVMATSASFVIDENEKILLKRRLYKRDICVNGKRFATRSFCYRNIFGEPSNILIRAEAIKNSGITFLPNLKYATDWDFWMKLASLGSIAYVDEYLMAYRVSRGNATSKLSIRAFFKDDSVLIDSQKEFAGIKLNIAIVLCHRVMCTLRMIARKAYIAMINMR